MKLLAAQVVDAGIACEAEEPGLELLGRLETGEGPRHLDKDGLGEILDRVAPAGDGVGEAGDAVLVGHNEVAHRGFVAALRPAYSVAQRVR